MRGTRFDPFGYTRVRRIERQLVADYEATVRKLVDRLTIDSYDMTLAVALAPDIVRGYEDVKLRNIERYRARLRELSVDSPAVMDPTDKKENGCG